MNIENLEKSRKLNTGHSYQYTLGSWDSCYIKDKWDTPIHNTWDTLDSVSLKVLLVFFIFHHQPATNKVRKLFLLMGN